MEVLRQARVGAEIEAVADHLLVGRVEERWRGRRGRCGTQLAGKVEMTHPIGVADPYLAQALDPCRACGADDQPRSRDGRELTERDPNLVDHL
jgi:hypothetical protein